MLRRRRRDPFRAQSPRGRLVVAIQGGLGNQLFQYGLGRGLAGQGFDVYFETWRLTAERPFELAALIPAERMVDDPLREQSDLEAKWTLLRQRGFQFDDTLLNEVNDRTVLLGHWTSPRYWFGQERGVRRTIGAFAEQALTPEGRSLGRRLRRSDDTWSVHIRRGDYVSNPRATAHHGNLPDEYYRSAMERARAQGARRFAIFSDDLDWVADHLAGPDDVLIERSLSTAAAGEIFLMSQCAGRIVANSTFSWWGGVLADRGTTIAPSRWFAGVERDHSDFVPETWERIPTFGD